jgi:hypothetical protein
MIKRLDGNNVLIIDNDQKYCEHLAQTFVASGAQASFVQNQDSAFKVLEIYDYDVIICSYYLPDGLIHHVIDWCKDHLMSLPVFVALGSGIPSEEALLQRHLISCVLKKGDHFGLVTKVQKFLFDFNKFYQNLIDMVEERGVGLELVVQNERFEATAIETKVDGVFVGFDEDFIPGSPALLQVSIYDGFLIENFTLLGSLCGKIQGGQFFKINSSYERSWSEVLKRIEERQFSITTFLSKAAGK